MIKNFRHRCHCPVTTSTELHILATSYSVLVEKDVLQEDMQGRDNTVRVMGTVIPNCE